MSGLVRFGRAVILVTIGCAPGPERGDPSLLTSRDEPHRPQVHFTPERGWMGAPSGLVAHDGVWHLFYQHFPDAVVPGPAHWGHAASTDLMRWEELPIALEPDDEAGWALGGSAVVERAGPSAVCSETPCLVAALTRRLGAAGTPQQALAWSVNPGLGFRPQYGPPAIAGDGATDRRDPRVFRWEDGWRMAVAEDNQVAFYASSDLLAWSRVGAFLPEQIPAPLRHPDLFPLPINGLAHDVRWVLTVGVDTGGPQGGSGTGYWLGAFDGTTFVPDDPFLAWLDHGADLTATQTFSDAPEGGRVLVGWMSNADYAVEMPTAPWRGGASLPRVLRLRRAGEAIWLAQEPASALQSLRVEPPWVGDGVPADGRVMDGVEGRALDLAFRWRADDALGVELSLRGGDVVVGWDVRARVVYVERAGGGDAPAGFARRMEAFVGSHAALDLRVVLDWSSVEVFVDDGRVTLTSLILPDEDAVETSMHAFQGRATLEDARFYALRSAWELTRPGQDP